LESQAFQAGHAGSIPVTRSTAVSREPSGSLCLLGLIGRLTNAIGLRAIGILGYTVIFAATCVPLARAFRSDGDDESASPRP
jgi:hypothetical protein